MTFVVWSCLGGGSLLNYSKNYAIMSNRGGETMEIKTHRMAVRVTESQFELLKLLALQMDLTISQYIRLQFDEMLKQAEQLRSQIPGNTL